MRWLVLSLILIAGGANAGYLDAPQVPGLLQRLRQDHGFTRAQLAQVRDALADAKQLPQLIKAERNAKEKTLTWDQYRPIHINQANITHGVAFMRTQRHWLDQAEEEYGVSPAVITALLGVETKYGAYTGRVRVLDALATQGFDHPTRGPFFLAELEQFFVMCRDQDLDPRKPRGSYAGAMGMTQFMPDSVLRFARDFDGNGRIDLWSPADAIGSVANYLANHDRARAWQRGLPLIIPATADGSVPADLPRNARYPTGTVAQLEAAGIAADTPVPGDLRAGLVQLQTDGGPRDWIALQNFYAVMSYNPRVYYAMSVAELARRLIEAEATTGP